MGAAEKQASFNLPYQTLTGLSTKCSTLGGPLWASEDEVLPVVPIILFIRERPALQTLVSLVYSVAYLQCPVHADVSLSQNGWANLQQLFCYCTFLHVNAH